MQPQSIGKRKKKHIFHAISATIHEQRIEALLLSAKKTLCALYSVYNNNPHVSSAYFIRTPIPTHFREYGSEYLTENVTLFLASRHQCAAVSCCRGPPFLYFVNWKLRVKKGVRKNERTAYGFRTKPFYRLSGGISHQPADTLHTKKAAHEGAGVPADGSSEDKLSGF